MAKENLNKQITRRAEELKELKYRFAALTPRDKAYIEFYSEFAKRNNGRVTITEIRESGRRPAYKGLDRPVDWGILGRLAKAGKIKIEPNQTAFLFTDEAIASGRLEDPYVDQHSVQEEADQSAKRREVTVMTFARDPEVRRRVRLRAQGKCQSCGQLGFVMENGKVFIETHHVVSLAEGGADADSNVVALCPNHHREAHHGARSDEMRMALLAIARGL